MIAAQTTSDPIDLVIIVCYLVGIMVIGIWAGYRKKTSSTQFFLAGRSLKWPMIGAALFTANPASFYGLDRKGRVAPGSDADLLFLDHDLQLAHVLARGQKAVVDGAVVLRGTFAEGP